MEAPFKNEAPQVIAGYVERWQSDQIVENRTRIAADILILGRDFSNRSAYGVCLDLSRNNSLVGHSSDALARLFHGDDSSLPENWRENPEIMRTVVSMAAEIDLGYLRAEEKHQLYEGVNPDIELALIRTQRLLDQLQERVSPPLGEGGAQLKQI